MSTKGLSRLGKYLEEKDSCANQGGKNPERGVELSAGDKPEKTQSLKIQNSANNSEVAANKENEPSVSSHKRIVFKNLRAKKPPSKPGGSQAPHGLEKTQ